MDIREGRLGRVRGLVVEVVIRRVAEEIYALIRLFVAQLKKQWTQRAFSAILLFCRKQKGRKTMCPYLYYEIMRKSKDKKYFRLKMAKYAQKHGNKPAARIFSTTVKTVRKWRRRYEESGYQGLNDQSRAPKNPAKRILPSQREKAIVLKKKLPSFGADRIKRDFELL